MLHAKHALLALLVGWIVSGISPLRADIEDVAPNRSGAAESSASIMPALKNASDHRVLPIRIVVQKSEKAISDCTQASVLVPYHAMGDQNAQPIPLKITIAVASITPGAATPRTAEPGSSVLADPYGENTLSIRIEEVGSADLDAFIQQLPAERRDAVVQGVGPKRPPLSVEVKHPSRADACLLLELIGRPPMAAKS